LDLLEGNAERVSELRLGQFPVKAGAAQGQADLDVNLVRP
jgi:hypothetical protein